MWIGTSRTMSLIPKAAAVSMRFSCALPQGRPDFFHQEHRLYHRLGSITHHSKAEQ